MGGFVSTGHSFHPRHSCWVILATLELLEKREDGKGQAWHAPWLLEGRFESNRFPEGFLRRPCLACEFARSNSNANLVNYTCHRIKMESRAMFQDETQAKLFSIDLPPSRHVRSTPEDSHKVSLDLVSHGRRFRLDLERDNEAFREEGSISNINLSPITALFIRSVARF